MKLETQKDFETAMEHFFNKEFPKASVVFDDILSKNPEDLVAKYFLTTSAEYTISGTPKDWNMINTLNFK